jgi:hypothetical protein
MGQQNLELLVLSLGAWCADHGPVFRQSAAVTVLLAGDFAQLEHAMPGAADA